MAPAAASLAPGYTSFLISLSTENVETSIENFIALLKRRQIKGSKPCAIATIKLLRRLISVTKTSEPSKLIEKVHTVGQRLVAAQPRELAIGNIIRRVLGAIREEEDNNQASDDISSEAGSVRETSRTEVQPSRQAILPHSVFPGRDVSSPSPSRPPHLASNTTLASPRPLTSMFSILAQPSLRSSGANSPMRSGTATPLTSPVGAPPPSSDLRAEVLSAVAEVIDELEQSDDQIASYALEYVHTNEVIFTYSSSLTVQRFLLKAASKRKFTVIHAEAYPNNSRKTHSLVTGNFDVEDEDVDMSAESFQKPLTAAGVSVILVPDSAIFALMSRANKVILGAESVLQNGAVVAAAGSLAVVLAAKHHHVPVIFLAGTYKLSPRYPHNPADFIEMGDVSKVIAYGDGEMRELADWVENPLSDFIEPGAIDLFVTNLGGVTTQHLYRIVRDQYHDEDVDL